MAFSATNYMQWPSLMSSLRCIFPDWQLALSCPYVPWKAQYLLVLLLLALSYTYGETTFMKNLNLFEQWKIRFGMAQTD
ncbi:unnamed protein product [Prunus armeniaca]